MLYDFLKDRLKKKNQCMKAEVKRLQVSHTRIVIK